MVRRVLLSIAFLAATSGPAFAARHADDSKLDGALRQRAHAPLGASRVIIQTTDGQPLDSHIKWLRGKPGRQLRLLGAQVAEIPDHALDALAGLPHVRAVSLDRPVYGAMERTAAAIGARWIHENLGFDGTGVGVAIIDSGVATAHDDLGPDRIAHFADFVSYQPNAYDDYGHGTHVAGIIAGSGYDSNGARRGIAPGASLVVLKVLDGAGRGHISNVIAALDYAVATRASFNTRVINLSVAAGVYESYTTDPLTLAAKRAVEAGIVVVTAAGNLGRSGQGKPQYGGITAPGNAPWVLTVGASNHMGTPERDDDTVAGFSSRGPSYIDYAAKPDLLAPGVGIESLTTASTFLYQTRPGSRIWGTLQTASEPYLSMSGTSMAAPVVAATVALLLQANPALTPNAVKAILQYTAESRPGFNHLTQGAGFLNARGAMDMALRFASGTEPTAIPVGPVFGSAEAQASTMLPATTTDTSTTSETGFVTAATIDSEVTFTDPLPVYTQASPTDATPWSRHMVWGSHRLTGGMIQPGATAWNLDVTWGSAKSSAGVFVNWGTVCDPAIDPDCENIVWGTATAGVDENIVWGTTCDLNLDPQCENIVWGTGTAEDENVVWGTECDGQDCENIVWGTLCDPVLDSTCENIVWGTVECDPVSQECENIVWGTGQCDPTLDPECDNIVWGTEQCDPALDPTCENIVWGTSCDPASDASCEIVWGSRALNPGGGQFHGRKPRR